MALNQYQAEVSDAGEYLRIVIHGDYSLDRGKWLIELIRDTAKSLGRSRVLLDARDVPEGMPATDAFELGSLAAAELRGLRVANIDPADALDGLAETVARNRGLNGRIFATETEALRWLLGQQP